MAHRTLATAAALLTTLAAGPAGGVTTGAPPGAWVPTLAHDDVFRIDAAAFPDGTGLVASDDNLSQDDDVLPPRRLLHRTADGGLTWTSGRLNAPRGTGRVAFGSPAEWWGLVGPFGSGLVRTLDAGATWSPAALPPRLSGVDSLAAASGAVAVAGRVANTGGPSCAAARSNAVAWSTNRGASWTRYRFPTYPSGNFAWVASVQVADARTGLALVTGDAAGCSAFGTTHDVHVTRDAGTTWTPVARSVPGGRYVQNASVTPAGLVSVGWSDGTVGVSEDGGATFRETTLRRSDDVIGGSDAVLHAVFSGRTGYAVQSSGAVWRTTDAGGTWTDDGQVAPLNAGGPLLPFDGSRVILAGIATVLTRVAP